MVQPVNDLSALCLTMIGEARGEGDIAMIAVGNTVMNRVRKKTWYGLTPLEVCLKHSNGDPMYFQYSCWNRGDPNRNFLILLPSDGGIYPHVLPLAQGLISGDIADNTKGATHYYALSMEKPPYWAEGKAPCSTIGNMVFFNNID